MQARPKLALELLWALPSLHLTVMVPLLQRDPRVAFEALEVPREKEKDLGMAPRVLLVKGDGQLQLEEVVAEVLVCKQINYAAESMDQFAYFAI